MYVRLVVLWVMSTLIHRTHTHTHTPSLLSVHARTCSVISLSRPPTSRWRMCRRWSTDPSRSYIVSGVTIWRWGSNQSTDRRFPHVQASPFTVDGLVRVHHRSLECGDTIVSGRQRRPRTIAWSPAPARTACIQFAMCVVDGHLATPCDTLIDGRAWIPDSCVCRLSVQYKLHDDICRRHQHAAGRPASMHPSASLNSKAREF